MKRWTTATRIAMVAALALLLTGCLKLDMDLKIGSDDTVSGSVVFGVSKDVLELTGGSAEDLLGGETPFPTDEPGVSAEPYDDGEFAGQEFKFDGVPISEFNDPEDPDALQIVRSGDTFEVSGVLDLAAGATGATGPDPEQFFASAEIRVAITFPGEVTESNGQVDGNTVVWEPKFGERLEIQATGSAIDSGGDSNTMIFVLIGIAIVVVVVVVVVVTMGRRKKGPEGPAAEVTPEAGMTTPPSAAPTALAPPAVPPAGPPSAPEAPAAEPPAETPMPEATAPEPAAETPESGAKPGGEGGSEGEGDPLPPPPQS